MRMFTLVIDEANVGDVIDTPLRLFTLPGGEAFTIAGQYILNGVSGPCSAASLQPVLECVPETAPGDCPLTAVQGTDPIQLGSPYTIPELPVTALPTDANPVGFSGGLQGFGRDADVFLRIGLVSGALDAPAFSLRVDLQFEKVLGIG